MKTAKQQIIDWVDKKISRERDKYADGLHHHYDEWKQVRSELFSDHDSSMELYLSNRISKLEKVLKENGLTYKVDL